MAVRVGDEVEGAECGNNVERAVPDIMPTSVGRSSGARPTSMGFPGVGRSITLIQGHTR